MNNEINNLLIHVGYAKCASSWLQQYFFDNEQQGFLNLLSYRETFFQFASTNSFDFESDQVRQNLLSKINQISQKGLIPVLSHEDLVGSPLCGYWGKEVADRFYSTFPEAKIFIIIREQKSMLMSLYRQYIIVGGTATIDNFLGINNTSKPFLETPMCLDFFEFDKLIEYYQNLFGKNKVLVLPLELLKFNQQLFFEKLLNFLNISNVPNIDIKPSNIGHQGLELMYMRFFNRLAGPSYEENLGRLVKNKFLYKPMKIISNLLPLKLHEGIENHWKESINERVKNTFNFSNQKTSHLIGFDLKELGYDC
ncbi:hypothetical protein VKI22_17895 [Cyanobacterium aponinum UTEX 3221]|uniref:Sulfotransferase domain-containing protein n=1 Tax=Cyanobacterium aponinum 0216 TaxID=2676140 RepID=A0A844GPV8_9CHRO|nr:hypothetical protein [Cyanobacterium aponinum]MBD2394111.1 hypothetical protein [Cyanobacterium aponinum FACHB-4101]MTF38594.1 hypothetical protein [Cyanobacterium aponinum 0216]WRL38460.1 hypothetical protein VKI22_17895 [Cyanobacterium aponinum UTEX 3221]